MPYARPTTMYTNGDTHISSGEPSPSISSTQVSSHPRGPDSAWQHRMSATFSQLSDQFREASQSLSTIHPSSSNDDVTSLVERLGYIEERQKNLEMEFRDLREHLSAPKELPATEIQNLLKAHLELYNLDQERLPGRLQNALATKSLSPLKMLPMKNGKFPPNAPATRGEYEHLTKERYEGLLICYDIPVAADIATRRESLRTFLGIPSTPLEKK